MFINVRFPSLNKNDDLATNDREILDHSYVQRCLVTDSHRVSATEWELLTTSLLSKREMFVGKGGTASTYTPTVEVDNPMRLPQAEREAWVAASYNEVVEIIGPERTIYVDPQGYDCGRYVGVLETEEMQRQIAEAEAERIAAARQAEVLREAARLQREADQAQARERGRAIYAQRPAWAKAAILARLEQDVSDGQSDYYASKTQRVMFLGWSRHTQDRFDEMRKAAATRPETAHLGPGKNIYTARVVFSVDVPYEHAHCGNYVKGARSHWHRDEENGKTFTTRAEAEAFIGESTPDPLTMDGFLATFEWRVDEESVEHREKYSMGKGYYLGTDPYDGWQVRKVCLSEREDNNQEVLLALGSTPALPTPLRKKAPAQPCALSA